MDEEDEAPLDELELMDEVDDEERGNAESYQTQYCHVGGDPTG
jgi:hypothetical protein